MGGGGEADGWWRDFHLSCKPLFSPGMLSQSKNRLSPFPVYLPTPTTPPSVLSGTMKRDILDRAGEEREHVKHVQPT
jgi:hypothetical protein